MEVKCVVCGKIFDKPKGRISRTKTGRHYCSRECYSKEPIVTQERTGREFPCNNCGTMVYKSGSQITYSDTGVFYCSKSCRASYIHKMSQEDKNAICCNCGIRFHTSPSKLKGSRLYCSRACWKDGIRSNGPVYYRKFKKDYCEECGFIPEDTCQLDIHHDDSNKKNNKESNLITLCANCHRLVHHKLREGEL